MFDILIVTGQDFIQRESFWGEDPGNGRGFIYFSIQLSQTFGGGGGGGGTSPHLLMKPCWIMRTIVVQVACATEATHINLII